jgi:hypothetical protein
VPSVPMTPNVTVKWGDSHTTAGIVGAGSATAGSRTSEHLPECPVFRTFLSLSPASSLLLEGHYDLVLVGLSVLVAILSAYGALLVSQHVLSNRSRHDAPDVDNRWWPLSGRGHLGHALYWHAGIRAALHTGYDTTLTLLSTVPGILASVLVVNTISHQHISTRAIAERGCPDGCRYRHHALHRHGSDADQWADPL